MFKASRYFLIISLFILNVLSYAEIQPPNSKTYGETNEKIQTVIDRTYPLSETAKAHWYAGKGHARGKVVITL